MCQLLARRASKGWLKGRCCLSRRCTWCLRREMTPARVFPWRCRGFSMNCNTAINLSAPRSSQSPLGKRLCCFVRPPPRLKHDVCMHARTPALLACPWSVMFFACLCCDWIKRANYNIHANYFIFTCLQILWFDGFQICTDYGSNKKNNLLPENIQELFQVRVSWYHLKVICIKV